jgi:hypothetical protein
LVNQSQRLGGKRHLLYGLRGKFREIAAEIPRLKDPLATANVAAITIRACLVAVAELSTLPVPEPIIADIEAGVLAYVKLPGLPLKEHPIAEPARRVRATDANSLLTEGHAEVLVQREGLDCLGKTLR